MPVYRVLIKASPQKEVEEVEPTKRRQRIVARVRSLAESPRPPGCEKLSGSEDRYRLRVGRYRVIYSISDMERIVTVFKVAHRREVYR